MRPLLAFALAAGCAAAVPHSVIGDEAPDTVAPSDAPVDAPLLQRAAEVEIVRDDPEAGLTAAATLARDHRGWVESMAGSRAMLRLPDAELDAAIGDLPQLGEIAARRVRAFDATEARRDLEVRIDTLRKTRDRYLALLGKAENVGQATAVEHELERITAQLERAEAALAAMEKRIAYSSLSLEFSRKVTPGPIGWVFYGAYLAVKKLFVWD